MRLNNVNRALLLLILVLLPLGCKNSSAGTTLTPIASDVGTETPMVTSMSGETVTPTRSSVTVMPTKTLISVDSQIGWVVIPSLDIEEPVIEVSWHIEQLDGVSVAVWDADDASVSHLAGSAALGAEGNCVLAGHSGGAESSSFSQLEALEKGDTIILRTVSGDEIDYTVTETERIQVSGTTVDEQIEAAQVLNTSEDTQLTLVTCWPEWGYTHRLIVTAIAE